MEDIIEEIKKGNVGKVEENVSLKKYTTYKVGGKARCIVYPKNVASLIRLLSLIKSKKIPYKVIGNGSNLLFSDNDYNGILIKLSEFNEIKFFGKNKVRAEAGASLIKLSLLATKKGLTGLEFASGIPGSIGGSVFMNAGAYKTDMGYVVEKVKVLTPDLKIIYLENKEMDFHYRTSFLKRHTNYICLEAILKLANGKREAIEEVIRDRKRRRLESQPLEFPSAGSVFRNPNSVVAAGKLIDDLGLKGYVMGGAMISEKHANFIVNYKNAKSSDIKYLIDLCHDKVLEEYGIDLKCEQEFVNWE